MKKKKIVIIISLIIILILGVVALLYSKPILLDINPFYEKESVELSDGTTYSEEYWKYSSIPTVKADLPQGWDIKTVSYKKNDTEELKGDVAIEIYKGTNLMASLMSITDTGGAGGVYFNFPDSDPEVYQTMLEYSQIEDGFVVITDVLEGEYTKLDLFGLEVRRVDDVYVPNTNEKDTYYFTNPLDPVLFYFEEDGPSFEVYYDGVQNLELENQYTLILDTANTPPEEDLLIVDSILDSMELR